MNHFLEIVFCSLVPVHEYAKNIFQAGCLAVQNNAVYQPENDPGGI